MSAPGAPAPPSPPGAPAPDQAGAPRIARAQAATAAAGWDGLLLTPGADLRHLTGYHALPLERLTCLVLPAAGPALLVVPELEEPRAAAAVAGRVEIRSYPETADPAALAVAYLRAACAGDPTHVGVANRMWAEHLLALSARLGPSCRVEPASRVLRALRILKDPPEVAELAAAAAAIDAVHAQLPGWPWVGRTERALGRDIADAILAAGHESVNFVIVASGPNSASPHHDTGDRVVASGDLVVVDIGGATAAGYCSDSTRTYAVGRPPGAPVRSMYAVLADAQEAACAAVRPGASAGSVDLAAREIIAAAGYGAHFIHRTGHGIGLEEHEEPWIVAGNPEPLAAGMAFSVEPGIYLPGRYGARIEDILVCTPQGGHRLNTTTRQLLLVDA